jgi:Protein of unknown function (DUF3455)
MTTYGISTAHATSLFVLVLAFATASAQTIAVPDNLKPPPTEVLFLEVAAAGVQVYQCGASKDDPTRFEWVFKAPVADLFDAAGKKIGTHYAGPTWESSDGSKVVGEVTARDNGPDATAIPWLLLSVKSTSGTGVFSRTKSIQRMHTVGGKAPAVGCDKARAGQEARMAYKATYYFYAAKP